MASKSPGNTPDSASSLSEQKQKDQDGSSDERVVMNDECGDSLWTEVLDQEALRRANDDTALPVSHDNKVTGAKTSFSSTLPQLRFKIVDKELVIFLLQYKSATQQKHQRYRMPVSQKLQQPTAAISVKDICVWQRTTLP